MPRKKAEETRNITGREVQHANLLMEQWLSQSKSLSKREFVEGCLHLIQKALKQGKTYEEITAFWMEVLKIPIDPSTVRKYVKDLAPDWQEPRFLTLKELDAQKAQESKTIDAQAQVIAALPPAKPTSPETANSEEAVVESQLAPESPTEVQAPVAEVLEPATEAVVTEPQAETAIAEESTSQSATEAVVEVQAEAEESASEPDAEVQSPEVEPTAESPTASEQSEGTSEDDWNEEELDEEEKERKMMVEACGLEYVPPHKRRKPLVVGNFRP